MLVYAMVMPPRNIAYGVAVAAAIGVLSSFIPAFSATRHRIAHELRAI